MKRLTRVLAAVPPWAYAPLRKLRTAALFAAEPLDRAHRLLTGRRHLPPLWLRRHVGPIAAYERAPGEIAAVIALRNLVHEDAVVLDMGCGTGVMAAEFARFLGPHGRYVGFDVHAPSVNWARRQYGRETRFDFEIAAIRTPYSERAPDPATSYLFPVASGSVDFALAKSLFTHLLEAEAQHFLEELARCLRADGKALLTAFLLRSPDERQRRGALYEFPYGGPDVCWMVESKPTAVVAYSRAHFLRMLHRAGLVVTETIDGYGRGPAIAPNAQDLLIVARGAGAAQPPPPAPGG
jgi:SAM-dependent methyltransferase